MSSVLTTAKRQILSPEADSKINKDYLALESNYSAIFRPSTPALEAPQNVVADGTITLKFRRN